MLGGYYQSAAAYLFLLYQQPRVIANATKQSPILQSIKEVEKKRCKFLSFTNSGIEIRHSAQRQQIEDVCNHKTKIMALDSDEVSLPRATVQKIISEVLSPEYTFSKDAREIITKSGIEFLMILSSMASEMADNDSKKTISPEHVIKALDELEYNQFIPFLEKILFDYKGSQRVKERKDDKFKKSGLSEEELLRQQEELFRQSRSRLNNHGGDA